MGSKSPLQATKDWHKLKLELFRKQPYYLPGCDNYGATKNAAMAELFAAELECFGYDFPY